MASIFRSIIGKIKLIIIFILTRIQYRVKLKIAIKLGLEVGEVKRPSRYNTKQSQAILSYIASLNGEHTTASRIQAHFSSIGSPIGIATIYRHLERLVECGKVHKYNIDGVSGACYQYCGADEHRYLHLKCESCGEISHFQCDLLDDVEQSIYKESAFKVNPRKTVLYGLCANCARH